MVFGLTGYIADFVCEWCAIGFYRTCDSEVGAARVCSTWADLEGFFLVWGIENPNLEENRANCTIFPHRFDYPRPRPTGYRGRFSRAGQQATGPIDSPQTTRHALHLRGVDFKPAGCACEERAAKTGGRFKLLSVAPATPR